LICGRLRQNDATRKKPRYAEGTGEQSMARLKLDAWRSLDIRGFQPRST
jgi:hypothetical protein